MQFISLGKGYFHPYQKTKFFIEGGGLMLFVIKTFNLCHLTIMERVGEKIWKYNFKTL